MDLFSQVLPSPATGTEKGSFFEVQRLGLWAVRTCAVCFSGLTGAWLGPTVGSVGGRNGFRGADQVPR